MWLIALLITIGVVLPTLQISHLERNLHKLLTQSEQLLLLGSADARQNPPDYAIVRPEYARRRRRAIGAAEISGINETQVVLDADALGKTFHLDLVPSPPLMDANFLVIERWNNRSQITPTFTDEQHCFFHSDKAAVSLCGGIRGIVGTDGDNFFTIHPLPRRFQTAAAQLHVILRQPLPNANVPSSGGQRCSHDETGDATRCCNSGEIRQPSPSTRDTFDLNTLRGQLVSINGTRVQSRAAAADRPSAAARSKRGVVPQGAPVHVETAVFVDRDLYHHMEANYPVDTERELVRFVLAMINAVQLLYHDETLGRPVNFMLKRLEILHEEPAGLLRPHDIDRFLSSFCAWQQSLNPPQDADPAHWDHALILTGLDLYVVSKHGKISSQVVGLAPVAGMCTATSSCTVNEGRHFESVYVVAHEIGHNLGMRHDGPHSDNDCDPSSFIMSPTLGSGKITWSACSRRYLQKFLQTPQSRCLLDHGSSAGQLDHTAEGVLPGERFDADQQCMLKYGKGSKHSLQQPLDDICRDLHCQRDRYTWTSHPALEGTQCGPNMWCRSGRCAGRGSAKLRAYPHGGAVINGGWTSWELISDCASGCLYGEEGRLRAGSSGIMLAVRDCTNPTPENGGRKCDGPDKKYQACNAVQCLNVPRMTVSEFADQICGRAREVDSDLTGTGLQRLSSDAEEACMVWCHKRGGGSKTRGWTFPDGTVCQVNRQRRFSKPTYCISGRCEEFKCDHQQTATFINLPELCMDNSIHPKWRNNPRRRESGVHWGSASGCHSYCMAPGTGIRLVVAKGKQPKSSIQLCQPDKLSCGRLKTPLHYATTVCTKYKERVRRLSGLGMQISPAVEDPDRPCRVACQDEQVSRRFYLVNGEEGWFPFGTDCSRGVADKKAYCISGKCLEFGPDDTPLSESEYTLPLLSRTKRTVRNNGTRITATLGQHDLDRIIAQLNLTYRDMVVSDFLQAPLNFEIDLNNPVHIPMEVQDEEQNLKTYYRDYYNEVYGQ